MIKEYSIPSSSFLSSNLDENHCVYLIRHGETHLNAEGVLQGSIEAPLNERGKEQAHQAASALEGLDIAHIISSPQIRARQTAEIIAQHLNVSIQENASLRERDWGVYEGKLRDERDDQGEGVEPIDVLNKRALNAFIDIASHSEKPCAVVTHSGLMKTLLNTFLGEAQREINNGEIIRITFSHKV